MMRLAVCAPPGRRTLVALRQVLVKAPLGLTTVDCWSKSTTASVSAGTEGTGRAASLTSQGGSLTAAPSARANPKTAMTIENAMRFFIFDLSHQQKRPSHHYVGRSSRQLFQIILAGVPPVKKKCRRLERDVKA